MELTGKILSLYLSSIENENNALKKEKYNLEESNIKFKQENDDLYQKIENKNIEIDSLERKNTDLEEEINEYKENFKLKGKDFINLIARGECRFEIKKKKLNLLNLSDQKKKQIQN